MMRTASGVGLHPPRTLRGVSGVSSGNGDATLQDDRALVYSPFVRVVQPDSVSPAASTASYMMSSTCPPPRAQRRGASTSPCSAWEQVLAQEAYGEHELDSAL